MSGGTRTHFSTGELAALGLPGLSRSKRKLNELAEKGRWALRLDEEQRPLARQRQGRGGGLEYHVALLPAAARAELVRRGLIEIGHDARSAAPAETGEGLWAWFERQSDKTRAEAKRRAAAVAQVEAHQRAGLTRSAAVASVAAAAGVGAATLWAWLAMVEGLDPNDRLPLLAPRRVGGGCEAEIDAQLWLILKSDYLRPEKPTWASCYRRTEKLAKARGLTLPCSRTLQRKFERESDRRLTVVLREGADALRGTLPPQRRTVAEMHALQCINMDGHKFDVFVRFPDGRIGRPCMVGVQDVFSRKLVSHRMAEVENSVSVRLALADLFERFGIPEIAVCDNGRGFAAKWITGGAKSRFRFKIKDDEPTGVLTALGVEVKWTLPYRGQSKPIERAFRDLCDTIAKHPELAGCYTGNRPDAKPENYGSRAVPFAQFAALVEREIAAHNARLGRRTEMGGGKRSFDQVFAESYAVAKIGRATAEQMRLALLTAEDIATDRNSGAIGLYGNRYWAEPLAQLAGKRVIVRFDPDDLHRDIHVYDRAGRYLTTAQLVEDTGFLDAGAAKARARTEAELKRTVRRAEALEALLSADEVAAMLPMHAGAEPLPSPSVIRPIRHRGMAAAALKPAPAHAKDQTLDRFAEAVGRLRVVD